MEPVAQLIRNESHPVIGHRIPLITESAKMGWVLLNPGSLESKPLLGMAEYFPQLHSPSSKYQTRRNKKGCNATFCCIRFIYRYDQA